jgi:uncharacterized membrane protein YfcA
MTPPGVCALAIGLGALIKALCGFGEAIIFIVVVTLVSALLDAPFLDPHEAVGLLVPVTFLSSMFLVGSGFGDIDWWMVRRAVPGMLGCGLIGVHLLVGLNPTVIRRWLGAFFLAVATERLISAYAERRRRCVAPILPRDTPSSEVIDERATDQMRLRRPAGLESLAAVLTGMSAGLLGGWFAVPGPPFMLFYSWFAPTSKGSLRATFILCTLSLNVVTTPSLLRAGIVRWELVPQYAAMLVASAVGTAVGMRLQAHVSMNAVMAVVLVLLCFSAVTMLAGSDGWLAVWITAALVVIAVSAVAIVNRCLPARDELPVACAECASGTVGSGWRKHTGGFSPLAHADDRRSSSSNEAVAPESSV